MPRAVGAWPALALYLLLTAIAWVLSFHVLPADATFIDEHAHLKQITGFLNGRFTVIDAIPMLPGYHALMSVLAWTTGAVELRQLRFISAGLALLVVPLAWLILRDERPETAAAKSLQLLFCPLFFIYFFLLYTDALALVLVLGGLLLSRRGQHRAAALILGAAVLVRQTNIVWVGFGWFAALADWGTLQHGWQLARERPRHWRSALLAESGRGLRLSWAYVLVVTAFAAFLIANDGVALNDYAVHGSGALYPGQIFWLSLAVFFLVLPLHCANLGKLAARLRSNPAPGLLAAAATAAFLATYSMSGPFNSPELTFFLRNELLARIDREPLLRVLAFIPMVWAILSVWVTPLERKTDYALYPLAIASLLPLALIENRYFLVPFALFTLLRQPLRPRWEWLIVLAYIPASAFLGWGVLNRHFFL